MSLRVFVIGMQKNIFFFYTIAIMNENQQKSHCMQFLMYILRIHVR